MDTQKYKFCTNCGTQITGGAQFCSTCGTKVQVGANESTDYQQAVEVPRSQLNRVPPINNGQTSDSIAILKDKIKKEFFSYHGRLNRLAYFKRLLVVLGCIGIICVIMAMAEDVGRRGLVKLMYLCYVALFICAISGIMLGIRRCYDLDKPWWFIGLTYIPYLGVLAQLYILFAKGTEGENTYGPDPLMNRNSEGFL